MEYGLQSVLGRPVHLTDTFKENYESWVDMEVFEKPIDWEELLNVNFIK